MIRRVALLIFLFAISAQARSLTGREKAIFDLYYAQLLNFTTNTIPGNFLVEGSVTSNLLDHTVVVSIQWVISNSNTLAEVESDVGDLQTDLSSVEGDVAGLQAKEATWDAAAVNADDWISWKGTNIPWRWSSTVPTNEADAEQVRTLVVDGTNLYICEEEGWAGVGTNWLRCGLFSF